MEPIKEETIKQTVVSSEISTEQGDGVAAHIETKIYLPGLISEDGKKVIHSVFVESIAAEFGLYSLTRKTKDINEIDEEAASNITKLVEGRERLAEMFAQAATVMYADEMCKYLEGSDEQKHKLFKEVWALFGFDDSEDEKSE